MDFGLSESPLPQKKSSEEMEEMEETTSNWSGLTTA